MKKTHFKLSKVIAIKQLSFHCQPHCPAFTRKSNGMFYKDDKDR